MEKLILQGTDETPSIIMDKDSNLFEFSGISMPEDPTKIFTPVIDWVNEYVKNPNPVTTINVKMDYFNTSSSKLILDVLTLFEQLIIDGKDVKLNWYYLEDDPDMKEAGIEFQDLVTYPFEVKILNKK